jgi:hypothetical protein
MLLFFISNLYAHSPSENRDFVHSISLGYQYRTLVDEELFTSPHCSVLQYGGIFTISNDGYLSAFVEPSISIVGLNQSIIQPSASLVLGFQIGDNFKVGSGPIVTTRDDQNNVFFPQLILESTFLFYVDKNVIPIKIGYVPLSSGLSQYQIVLGYTWN